MLENKKIEIFSNTNDTVAVYGSLKNTGMTSYSLDPDAIQNESYKQGLDGCLIVGNTQTKADYNSPLYVLSRELAYIQENGIKGWLSSVKYKNGSLVSVVENNNYYIFKSLIDNNLNINPINDNGENWQQLILDYQEVIANWKNKIIYKKEDIVKIILDGNLFLYQSLINNNLNINPVSDNGTNWLQINIGSASGGNVIFDVKYIDYKINDISWVNSNDNLFLSGDIYEVAYNHLLQDIQGKETTTATIGNTTITYYQADDGHKIVDIANISQVEEIYNNTGIAWFYILDTENKQFKLPRSKWGFVGYRGDVGGYVEESLPNITGDTTAQDGYRRRDATGAFQTVVVNGDARSGDGGTSASYDNFNASRSSPAYKNGAPVQQRATEMYLYFYVGNFSKEAIENTAGLNTELFNNKVNLNGDNATFSSLSTEAKENIQNCLIPDFSKDGEIHNLPWTATSNGFINYSNNNSSTATQLLINGKNTTTGQNKLYIDYQCFVKKGDVLTNSSGGATNIMFWSI